MALGVDRGGLLRGHMTASTTTLDCDFAGDETVRLHHIRRPHDIVGATTPG
jgi:hypothetical protein